MKRFAFLVHPRDTSDVARRFWFTRFLPARWTDEAIKRLKGGGWYTICSHFEVFEVEGYIIAVPLTGKQMITLPRKFVCQKILEAILFAQDKLGVELIGLGALTASVTDGGRWVCRQSEVQTPITHGDSYAVSVAEEGIEKIVSLCGLNQNETKVGIVGAHGIIGTALTKVLVQKGYQLILIGRSRTKLERLKEGLVSANNILTSIELGDIYDADIVVSATSHPDALLGSEYLRQGAVVYDISQPMNVPFSLIKERPDILKIDGCYVNIDGIELGFNMGTPKGTTFACLVETIMQALEGEKNHHVGEIESSHIENTKRWAQKYGFSHAPFSCFSRPIPLTRFQEISELREKRDSSLVKILEGVRR